MAKDIHDAEHKTAQQTIIGITYGVGKSFFRYGMNYLMIFINIGAIVLMTVVAVGFQGWNYLWTPTFLVTTIILFIIYISTHWSLHNLRLKKLREVESNTKFINEKEDEINKVTNTVEWIDYCGSFISWRDTEKKKEAWKMLMQNSLIILDKKYRKRRFKKQIAIDSREITDYERQHLQSFEIEQLQYSIDKAKNNNHYTLMKRKYQQQLEDEWIARNLDKINVDHDDVDRLFVENGTMTKQQKKSKSQASYIKDNWASRIVAILMSGFITAFTAELAMSWTSLEAWIVFAIRMLNLVINVIMGLDYGVQYYKNYDIHNVQSRLTITKEFKAWALSKGIYKTRGE